MEQIIQLNSNANLSQHFTLGEFTRSKYPEVYNIPSHEAIANLKRLCIWLEELRQRYNDKYVAPQPLSSRPSVSSSLSSRPSEARGEISWMRLEAQAASRKDVSTTLDMTGGGGRSTWQGGGGVEINLGAKVRKKSEKWIVISEKWKNSCIFARNLNQLIQN